MKPDSIGTSTIHEIKVFAFKEEISFANQVKRVCKLVGLMEEMVGFIGADAFYNEKSNRWVMRLLWKKADEPYVVSATTADVNAIIARLTQSARLVRVIPSKS